MKRLHYFNLIGVLALASLCIGQWLKDRTLNLELNRLERARLELTAKLVDQESQIHGLSADLAQFKQQYAQSQVGAAEATEKLHAAEGYLRQLRTERDRLQASVTNWAASVGSRDERLKEGNTRIRELADELNASVRRFNDLASNHNAVVKDLNELRARLATSPAARQPDRPLPQ